MGWNSLVLLITLLFIIGLLGLITYNKYLHKHKLNELKIIIFIFSILYIAVHFYNKRLK